MRMRKKPWARPELEACHFNIMHPSDYYGKWHERFNNTNPIHMELGCGKGTFIAVKASQNLNVNYIAIDIKSEVLALAKRNIESAYELIQKPVDNVVIMSQDIERIDMMMSEKDVVERIYINFCNPWHKSLQQKKRLTHPKQISKYLNFLSKDGEIWFKTDDDMLFADSKVYFEQSGFTIKYITYDLHNSDFTEKIDKNITTEHEDMFTKKGIPIKFLIAINKNDNYIPVESKKDE